MPINKFATSATSAGVPAAKNVRGAQALVSALQSPAVQLPARSVRTVSPKEERKRKKLLAQANELNKQRQFKRAGEVFEQLIALTPDPSPALLINRLAMAAKAADHAYVVENYQAVRARATTVEEISHVDQAWVDCLIANNYYDEALKIALAWWQAKRIPAMGSTAGVILEDLGRLDEAIAQQKVVLALHPDCHLARWHLSLHQQKAGILPEAFENYEARWLIDDIPTEKRRFDIPAWKGEPLEGRKILLWREQGIGDEIRFTAMIPEITACAERVTFECSGKLQPLFKQSFPDVEVRSELPPEMRRPEHYTDFDYHLPIGSLPLYLRPTAQDLKDKAAPWLVRRPDEELRLREAMDAKADQPIIGLCWRSSVRNLHRNKNYLPPQDLAALKLLGNTAFICLQYDECQDEVELMRELGLPITYFANIDQKNDMLSTAALTGACDMVVSAGTTACELSAGLGIPTILFGPRDARLKLGTDTIPWHPKTRHVALDPDTPMAVVKTILTNWEEISRWAARESISGRQINWSRSFPR